MKKKIFIYLLLLLPAFLCQSCLKDQEDLFDKDAGLRVQDVMNAADKALSNSEYGWLFNYFPDENQKYGGYAYTVQFKDGVAKVGCELAASDYFEESDYQLKNYSSATLSFDTYNTLIHYFATPSSSNYQAYHGDFEFTIDSIGDDVVRVHGIRTGNVLYFTKLTESPEEYLKKVEDMADGFIVTGYKGTVGTTEVEGSVNMDNRQITLSEKDDVDGEAQSGAYVFTDKGIRFYEPFEINGGELDELTFDPNTSVFTGVTSTGEEVSLQGILPENYVRYDEFAGDYTLCYYPNTKTGGYYYTIDVKLVPDESGTKYHMQGLNDKFSPVLEYNRSYGRLELNAQKVGTTGSNTIYLAAWGLAAGGSILWVTGPGMVTVWNGDTEHPEYSFTSNSYSGLVTDSFILWMTDADGKSAGGLTDSSFFVKNTYQIPYLSKLIKK